jgi:GST-like protein
MPTEPRARYATLQWLMFQMGGVGPMLGQAHHFRLYAPEKIAYGIDRYTNEAKRLYGVMDKQVSRHAYMAGDDYTIADIAIFPWLRSAENQGVDWADYPALKAWFDRIAERPAVQRGVAVLADLRKPVSGDKERDILFGKQQYAKR